MQTGTPFFPEFHGGKKQRISGVWLANEHAPLTLSAVLVYTILGYFPRNKTLRSGFLCFFKSVSIFFNSIHPNVSFSTQAADESNENLALI